MDKQAREELIEKLGDVRKKEEETQEEYVERIRKELNHDTKVISVIIQKGGTGKTTCASNMAYMMAKKGFNVLLVDSDSQASLTVILNQFDEDTEFVETVGLSDLYAEVMPDENGIPGQLTKSFVDSVIKKPTYTEYETKRVTKNGKRMIERIPHEVPFGFDFICGDISLADVEIDLATSGDPNAGITLLKIVDFIKENYNYDFIIFDCAPGLGFNSYNCISCAANGGLAVVANMELINSKPKSTVVYA